MSWHKHLMNAICLLNSCLFCAVGAAGDAPAGQIVGLYHRGGLGGIVLEEMLQTEGIPYARLDDLSRLEESGLRGLVLDGCPDTGTYEIKRFLKRGGALLTLKPTGALAEALGLEQVGVQNGGYLVVGARESKRISYEGRLQLFGQSIHYRGGESLVRLEPEESYGGILRVKRGAGTAWVVSFDLATTLLTLLQPVSQCGKTMDASNVDYDLAQAPQADLMRRFLVGLLLESIDVPVMRKWYFPSRHLAMLVVLGDQDGADFRQMKVVLDMIKELKTPYTLFVTPTNQPLTKEQFKILAEGGMEFALHPDFVSAGHKFTQEEFQSQWKKAAADVGSMMTGERTHSARWESFRETPSWAEREGLRYDAILGMRSWESKPAKNGYMLGTGLPYWFIDPDCPRRLDFLEIPTAGCDNTDFWKPKEYTVRYKPGAYKTFLAGMGLTEDEAFTVWKEIFNQAVEKYHTVNGYCWHPVYLAAKKLNIPVPYRTDGHFARCIGYAKDRGIGLIGANALDDFWRARRKVAFKDISWDSASATVQYRIVGEVKVSSLTLTMPLGYHGKKARLFVNGQPADYGQTNLFGSQYAMFAIDVGMEELLVSVRYDLD